MNDINYVDSLLNLDHKGSLWDEQLLNVLFDWVEEILFLSEVHFAVLAELTVGAEWFST